MTAAWKQAILVLLPTHTHSAALSCHNIHRHRRTDAGLGCGAGTGAKTKLSGASQSGTKIHLTTTTFSTTSTANSAGFASFHTLAFSHRERTSERACKTSHPIALVGVDGPLSGSFDSSQNYCESHRFIAVVVHLQKIQSHTMSIVVIAQIKCTLQTICSGFDSVTVDKPMTIWENIETLLSLNYAHSSLSPCGNGQLNK